MGIKFRSNSRATWILRIVLYAIILIGILVYFQFRDQVKLWANKPMTVVKTLEFEFRDEGKLFMDGTFTEVEEIWLEIGRLRNTHIEQGDSLILYAEITAPSTMQVGAISDLRQSLKEAEVPLFKYYVIDNNGQRTAVDVLGELE